MLGLAQGAPPAAPATPRDASTLLLLRGEAPEVFMVKRTGRASFMANAVVFPGGRVDHADLDAAWAARCTESPAAAAARLALPETEGPQALALLVAAARETFEEAGLLLARPAAGGETIRFDADAAAERFAAHRAAVHADAARFLPMLAAEGLVLETHALVYLARWITPAIEAKRFDTRFFAARAPAGQTGAHDTHETTASAWFTPAAAVADCEAGRIQLAPPTYRILLELADLRGVEAVLTLRGGAQPVTHAPRFDTLEGELTLLLPGDALMDGPAGARNRIALRGERWVSEGRGF
jgi:8-oxo-dGTP pyrophosphatase MutT (NUDIX family)